MPARRAGRRASRDRVLAATLTSLAMLVAILASAPLAWAQTITYRVNAGGPAVSGTPTWGADTKASPSPHVNAAETGNTTFSTTSTIDMTHASLPSGTPELLFKDDRWDGSGAPEMQWNFPVTAGTYEVRLYFAETFSGAMTIGGRKFDVSVEGSVKLNDYDIFAEVGANKAVMKSFVVSTDANLDIDFAHVVENPTVSAIEVLTSSSTAEPIGFGKSKLAGTSSTNPTSLQFGPDGRLYVAQQDGLIKVYTVSRNGANNYSVTATQTIDLVKNIPNHNDNGVLNTNVTSRIITGILVTGTSANPVIYATSSDPRIGGGPSGSDLGLDTNSSMLSKLTSSGSSWQKIDLVRGLPRSEENHSANGLQLDPLSNTLYVAQGGNTNMGAPSNNFAFLPEFALSATILAIDLDAIGNTTYDIPTLDDESRTGNPDANDPFGGNDGKNQARLISGGPVQIHAPGFRNAYDLLRHSNGQMYTIDNGGNAGWGDIPVNEGPQGTCTNDPNEPGHTDKDTFHLIKAAGYGGHPNPTRGNTANTFNTTNPPGPQSPIETANKIECDYRTLPERGHLVEYPASTNGLTEYTASNFAGALKGDILAASFDNSIYRVKLNAQGATLLLAEKLFSAVDNRPLDVTTQGDTGSFPGTIWVGDHGSGAITVFEPNDFGGGGGGGCTGANDPVLDEDGDGFTNSDEIANGTNPCSAADQPPDWDGDKVSNLNDPDDDNDGRLDTSDPFAIDANNGTATTLPVTYTWDNDGSPSPGGLLELGFTGLMTNGTSNYESLYDASGMTAGGAAGVTTIDQVPAGDAFKASNTQQYGFQLGVKAPTTGLFTAHTRILSPFAGITPQDFQSMGLFIGNGDQDNYVKLVTAANAGNGGIELLKEVGGATTKSLASVAMPGPDYVDLYLTVDPAASTVQASYAVTSGGVTGAVVNLAPAQTIPSGWLSNSTTGLAVGIISTSTGPGPEFPATWDFVKVQAGGPPGAGTTLPGAWETRASSPTNRQEVSYVNVGGKFYLAGGGTQHEVYNPSTNSWETVAPLPANLDHIQGVAVNGKIYYVGGLVSWPSPEVDTVYIYDPASNSFSQGAKMPRPRGAGGVAVHNDKIYYAGGLHGGVAVPWFDVYDPAANSWSQLPDMPTARDHFHAAVVNGKFYAIGGRNKDINATTAANQAFSFATGSWQAGLAPLPTPRGGFAAAVLGDEILIIGGEGGGSTFGTVEAYKTTTNAWRTLKPMSTPRHGIQAAVCNGGVYIAAGGKTQGGAAPSNVHEVFFLSGSTVCTSSDTTAPTVASVSPAPGATGVAVGSNVAATFSEAMDAATITTSTFTLAKAGTATPVPATVSYGASATATLNPGADLEPGVTYTATVKGGSGGVKDLAGNPLAQDKVWSFTTAGSGSPSSLASDSYSRVVTGGWGMADTGGAWSLLSGTSSNLAADGSMGTIQTPTGSLQQLVHLGSVSARDVDLTFEVTFPTTVSGAGGVFAYGVLRRQSGGSYYRIGVFVDAAGKVWIRGQNQASLALFPDVDTGLAHVGATTYVTRVQTAGASPTTIRTKVWKATETEPAAWAAETTDGTLGPQTAGSIGIRTISTSQTAMALAFDDFVATSIVP